MSTDKNRKPPQDLRWMAFQSFLAGIVIISVVGLFFFIYLEEGASSHSSYSTGKGLGFLLILGVLGLWMVVRGIIYLVRALSGDEQYAKKVEDVMDKFESRYEAKMKGNVPSGSMHNVLVLLCWVFLFLAVVGAIAVGYLFWTRPR